jgi:hypothetical protein
VQNAGSGSLIDRAMGVSMLNVATYEEIEHDRNATTQALIVVIVVAIASGIGQLTDNGFGGLIGGLIGAVVFWLVFSAVAYVVGTMMIPGDNTSATVGQLLRCMGFAQAPDVLAIFALIPVFGGLIALVGGLWSLVTAIVGLRQALDVSTGRAIVVGIISAIVSGIIAFIVMLPFGVAAWALG